MRRGRPGARLGRRAPAAGRGGQRANDEAWRWNKVRRKTDRDDALKLARVAADGTLPTVHVPDRPSGSGGG